jgi:hypothetical protein
MDKAHDLEMNGTARKAPASRQEPPTHLPAYASICLQALAAEGLGDRLSIGGALGLLHYLDYRPTHDLDAWWEPSATTEEREQVLRTVQAALEPFGQVHKRVWGDVTTIELTQDVRTVFSFQIAARSAQLQSSERLAWVAVLVDSFPDLVSSKMVALVERGAPRDFRDIYALCQAGLTAPAQCWLWWRRRQQMAGSDVDARRARLAIETHLSRIAQHRPLEQISDANERMAAERVRTWFAMEFLNALED